MDNDFIWLYVLILLRIKLSLVHLFGERGGKKKEGILAFLFSEDQITLGSDM